MNIDILKKNKKKSHKLFFWGGGGGGEMTRFFCCKKMKISLEKKDIFLILVQNIDCGYTFEPPC